MNTHAKKLISLSLGLIRIMRGGQITLPAEVRKALRLGEGDYLEAEVVDNRLWLKPVVIVPRDTIEKASERPAVKPIETQEELEEALLAGLNSGEREEVTPEYQAKLDQEVQNIASRSTSN